MILLRALWNSKSGLIAQQNKLDSISNNLANVNTVGYKREDVSFQELVQETLKEKDTQLQIDQKSKQEQVLRLLTG